MIGRRGFIAGLVSALAAPAIVRTELIMPVRSLIVDSPSAFQLYSREDLADLIYNIEPTDTPILDMVDQRMLTIIDMSRRMAKANRKLKEDMDWSNRD